jgi:hypothetical protein
LKRSWTVYTVLYATLAAVLATAGCGGERRSKVKPFNRVVVLLDASGTMMKPDAGLGGKVPFNESLRMLQDYFVKAAEQKGRRWDALDEYHIVAVDAHSQEVWHGDRKALAALTPEELSRIFGTRKQFSGCTDIGAAFEEAARLFDREPQPSAKFLLSFSDLISEPTAGGYGKCAVPSGQPPQTDWSRLGDVSMSFYWVSSDFRYQPDQHWQEALRAAGFNDVPFSNAAQTVSRGITLNPPPRARRVVSEEEMAETRDRVESAKSWALWLGVIGAAAVGLFFGCAFFLSKRARPRRPAARRA